MKADIILAVIIIVASFLGYKKGFIKSFLNLFFVLFSALGCYLMYPYAADLISKTGLDEYINGYIVKTLSEKYISSANAQNPAALLLKYNVDTVDALIPKMADGLTVIAMNIIAAIVVFVGIRIIFFLIKGVFGFLTKIPVIGSIDSLLGAVASFVSAMLVVFLFFAVVTLPPCNKSEFSHTVREEIDKSFLTKRVMEYNIFVNYDSKTVDEQSVIEKEDSYGN